jgi:hypothetical protein
MKLYINCGIPNPNIKFETQTRMYLPPFPECNWKLLKLPLLMAAFHNNEFNFHSLATMTESG